MNLYSYLPNYVISALAFIGTYCLIIAYQKQYEIENVLNQGVKTAGTVIEIRERDNASNTAMAVIEYRVNNNIYKHYSSPVHLPGSYKTGQKVPIWYYHYKSIRQAALADDKPGALPKRLMIVGIIFCLLSYPEIIRRILTRL